MSFISICLLKTFMKELSSVYNCQSESFASFSIYHSSLLNEVSKCQPAYVPNRFLSVFVNEVTTFKYNTVLTRSDNLMHFTIFSRTEQVTLIVFCHSVSDHFRYNNNIFNINNVIYHIFDIMLFQILSEQLNVFVVKRFVQVYSK